MGESRCEFSITPEDWTAKTGIPCEIDDAHLEDGTWRCPRTKRDDEHCVFHQPATATDDRVLAQALRAAAAGEVSPDTIDDEALCDSPTDRERARLATQLMGTRAERVVLSYDRIEATGTQPLDLRYSDISRVTLEKTELTRSLDLRGLRGTTVALTGIEVDGDCRLDDARIEEVVDAEGATVAGEFSAQDATIGRVAATALNVRKHVDWRQLTVRGGVDIRGARIDGRLRCRHASVDGDFDGSRIYLTGEQPYEQIHQLSCYALTATGSIVFDGAVVDGAVRLNDAQADGDLTITDATLRSHLWLGAVDSENGRSGSAAAGGSIRLSGTTIAGELDLAGAGDREGKLHPPTVGGTVDLSSITVAGTSYLEPDLSSSHVNVIDASNASLSSGTVRQATPATPVVYDFSRATIGDCRFETPTEWESDSVEEEDDRRRPLQYARFLETEFDGFDFAWHREQIDAQSWEIHRTASCSPTEIARSRHYDSAARYARDVAALFEVYPDARAFVADHDADTIRHGGSASTGTVPFTATDVATQAFGSPSAAPDLSSELPAHEVLPAPIGTREYSRMGLVTRLIKYYTNDIDHQLIDVFETPAAAAALIELANAIETTDDDVTAAAIKTEINALAVAIADLLATPSTYDLTPSTLESTYLRARNGADKVGDTTAVGEFYIQELKQRRQQHARRIRAGGGFGAVSDYISNVLLEVTAGYGERPRNVIVIAVLLVLGFSGIFAVTMEAPPYNWSAGYLILSLESFVTLVLGGADAVPSTVRLIAQIEGFLGAFLIALFVFTLTRSIDR